MVKSHDIPEQYNVSDDVYRQLQGELDILLVAFYEEFNENGHDLWEQVSVTIGNNGEFKVDYVL